MANSKLFQSRSAHPPRATACNNAGGSAYARTAREALAQYAATGCLNATYYVDAPSQLDVLQGLIAGESDPRFLAKLALYSRERAYLKDLPAALLVALSSRDPALFQLVFPRVVDNGRMLRTLFQMIRSGLFGRSSLSGTVQRAFRRWLNSASVERLLSASVGSHPSLADILRLARPLPVDNRRRALFGWLVGKSEEDWAPAVEADLPDQVRALQSFRAAKTSEQQFQLLRRLHVRWDSVADCVTGPRVWGALARQMGPQALRMNLNTLARHDAFADRTLTARVATRLMDRDAIRRSRQFPYQYFAAYKSLDERVPKAIHTALKRSAELACGSVPQLPGPVVIGLDMSGSMSSPITGHRHPGGTLRMRCIDVAALVAAALLRRNPGSVVIPFDDRAHDSKVWVHEPILRMAERLTKHGGGGTDCSLPIRQANTKYRQRRFAGVVLVSDNESWLDHNRLQWHGQSSLATTGVSEEWQHFVRNQYRLGGAKILSPKLICIDLQPGTTTQAPDRHDILNVGGFNDAVFEIINSFLGTDSTHFAQTIEAIPLDF